MSAHDPEHEEEYEESKDVHKKDDALSQWQVLRKELSAGSASAPIPRISFTGLRY